MRVITNYEQLAQATEQVDRMRHALRVLKEEVLGLSEKWFKLMAEGPLTDSDVCHRCGFFLECQMW